jgi:hypothetical protein
VQVRRAEVPEKPEQSAPDGVRDALNGLITLAGATAGIAALIYFIGAVTIWARLRAAGFPADIAAEHESRGEVLAVGVRGIVALVLAIAAGIVLPFLLARYLLGSPTETPSRASAPTERPRPTPIPFAVACLIVIVVASFRSWHFFAFALAFVAVGAATVRFSFERLVHGSTRPSLPLIVSTLLAVGAAATAWQIQPPVHVQSVIVVPIPGAKGVDTDYLKMVGGVAVPYFGETSTHVYVAQVQDVQRTTGQFRYTHRILEIPRDGVRLIFPEQKSNLRPHLHAPGVALAIRLWHAVD